MRFSVEIPDRWVATIKRVLRPGLFPLGVVVGLMASSLLVYAAVITKPYTFTDGQVISAAQVNGNFDALFSEENAKETRMQTLEAASWTKNSGGLYTQESKVGVGNTAPGVRLDVNGAVRVANDSATCSSSIAGAIRWNGTAFQGCNGTSWVRLDNVGSASGASFSDPGINCKSILADYPSSPSGVYWIDPDGTSGSQVAFQAYCDMTSDGGGWTLLITLTKSTVTNGYATLNEWPTTVALTGGEPTSTGMYKGSLASFSEVREEVASGKVKAYGKNKSASELDLIRNQYGYSTRVSVTPTYATIPACRLAYTDATDNLPGCSRYTGGTTTTVIGWLVDPNTTYSSSCWFARGNCCSSSGGSALCVGDVNGTTWARTWFR